VSDLMKQYYDLRAPAYDDWYLGRSGFAGSRDEEAWNGELDRLVDVIRALPPARTLDVACGTGFLTRHVAGDVVALDASPTMLEHARRQAHDVTFVRADTLGLPFGDGEFDRVFTGHFYGHLDAADRHAFLAEARRVACELVVVDAALRPDHDVEEIQQWALADGSRWPILKRYFTPERLAQELGGGETLFAGEWFLVVRATW
jgi:demethylmenaquinone methyltransferase/2-methoxy-6-polyprenyl-1,4-benzoquinol methylase